MRSLMMRSVDRFIGVFFVLFGGFWIVQASRFEFLDVVPGPGFLPMSLAVLIVGLGILLLVTRQFGAPEKFGSFKPPTRHELMRAGSVAAITALGMVLLPYLGFMTTFVLMIVALLFGLERMRTVGAAVTAVAIPVATYLVFSTFLGVRLPEGPFGI